MDEILTVVSIEETLLKELSTMVDMVEKINIEEGSAIIAEQSVEYAMHMSAIYHVSCTCVEFGKKCEYLVACLCFLAVSMFPNNACLDLTIFIVTQLIC